MYVSLARACDPSTRKLEEIFNHFTYQIETPPHTPHIEYKSFSRVSFEIFNNHEMTINVNDDDYISKKGFFQIFIFFLPFSSSKYHRTYSTRDPLQTSYFYSADGCLITINSLSTALEGLCNA